MALGDAVKRVFLGRKLRSSQAASLLPKRLALPAFASDALSSVAYAPDEIFIMLALAGASAYVWTWQVAAAVAVVMLVVVASYRQNVQAYPGGGGDYQIARENLGPTAGTTVASALLVDYVLTVAVSVSAGVHNAVAAFPFMAGREVLYAAGLVVALAVVNLRGLRGSAHLFAVPTYGFIAAVGVMGLWGLVRARAGDLPPAESADLQILEAPGYEGPITTLALFFLLARAFSSGCVALTGVEAISTGVPAFRRPKGRNAANTLLILGFISVAMMLTIISLAREMRVRYVDPLDLDLLVRADGTPVGPDHQQNTLIAQIARGVFDNFDPAFYLVIAMTATILVLAANTAFNGFPTLGSMLARDGYMPRQLGARGDRLAFNNGILFLAVIAIALVVAFDAQVTRLIQLYIVGVFVSFTVSQFGMVRHWTTRLADERDPVERRRIHWSRAVNAVGLGLTAVVLLVVVVTKFLAGAWIAILAMVLFFLLMRWIHRHYDSVGRELAVEEDDQVLPTRVHAIVLVSRVHKPTMRALAYAKAARPNVLEAVMVSVDPYDRDRTLEEWDRRGIDVPLKILDSPYREVVKPIVDYAKAIKDAQPRGVVAVFIPEYVVGHWWERLLHNQTTLRLKARLLFTPGVMMISVPFQLQSSARGEGRAARQDEQMRAGPVGAVRWADEAEAHEDGR